MTNEARFRVGIVGTSGYTGAELLRLISSHPRLEVVRATAHSNVGVTVAEQYPSLGAAYPGLEYEAFDPAALAGLDVVFCGLPHGQSQVIVGDFIDTVGHVVDLGADFRLPASDYERWYDVAHKAPELLERFAFGLPELYRAEIAAHDHVAAPGCYPTAAALALAPLLAGGHVEPAGIVVDAVSGVSGAGRGASLTTHLGEAGESVNAYGLLTHRHTAEIELALGHVAGAPVEVLFTPHLAPMTRGILATAYARPAGTGLTTAAALSAYRDYYADEPFVLVVDEPPATKAARGSNLALVTVRVDERTGMVLALGAIDNLVKGASGQALQAANMLLGLAEGTALPIAGVYP
ncbi:MAG TPA: N-acetyl-gamma-glutamyl-phosphate reductase [Acidimicrobiia bacterium]|nr:N-acetyl-gamma-glutamyl-phosphate reductase [Acidimicrobiia bacterium]